MREHYYDKDLVHDLVDITRTFTPSGKMRVTSSAVRFARSKLIRQVNIRDKKKLSRRLE